MRENYISRFQRLFRHACVLIRTHMHNACVFDRRFLAIPFIFMLLSVLGRKGNICHSLQVLNESSSNYNFEPSAAAEATEGAESEPPKWRDPDRRKKREYNADIKKTAEGRLNDWLKRYDKFNLKFWGGGSYWPGEGSAGGRGEQPWQPPPPPCHQHPAHEPYTPAHTVITVSSMH